MSPPDLTAIRSRCLSLPDDAWHAVPGAREVANERGEVVAICRLEEQGEQVAAFVAQARTDVLRLLAHIDALTAEVQRLNAAQFSGQIASELAYMRRDEKEQAAREAHQAEVDVLTPRWRDGEPPCGWVWREIAGDPAPAMVFVADNGDYARVPTNDRIRLVYRPWGTARWCPIRGPG